jgi:hypothetical protein
MTAKEWLDKQEWENKFVESVAWSHHTTMDRIMEEYAKHYMSERLKDISNKTKIEINKFI